MSVGGGEESLFKAQAVNKVSGVFCFFANQKCKIKYFSFSGEVKDSVIFPFYFLLHKRAKPAPPLTFSLRPPIHPYLTYLPPIHPFLNPNL